MQINQPQNIKPKMREDRLKSGVNWLGALKPEFVKYGGVKQGLDVVG
jgi:hypothetical protein